MNQYGNNINGLAGSAQRSSEVFTKLGSDVRDSGTGRQLQQLGVGAEELAQITALSAVNSRKLDLGKEEDYKKQKAAAQELAQQIAETSLITGMNREAITKSVEAETKKNQNDPNFPWNQVIQKAKTMAKKDVGISSTNPQYKNGGRVNFQKGGMVSSMEEEVVEENPVEPEQQVG
jgi:hypothetical protein